jgi:2,3-bisphosphoglycerate-independent phosphoglycerate mutase
MVNAGNGPQRGPSRSGVGPGGQHPGHNMRLEVLVILDGASEPLREGEATSLERATTPALDALARTGTLTQRVTTPPGLAPGSEIAIPVLLGWTPDAPVDRGRLEAAAHGIAVPWGEHAWRVDVLDADGDRAGDEATARAALALGAHRLGGHRLLVVGAEPPRATEGLLVWPQGITPPRILDRTTVVIAARGACAGAATLLGARVLTPPGATGGPNSDLRAKARAAVAGIAAGTPSVLVHAGGADEAAHARDARGKRDFLSRADRELITPLAAAVRAAGGILRVCADHGCDPATGRHDADPVPHLTWDAQDELTGSPSARLTERATALVPA